MNLKPKFRRFVLPVIAALALTACGAQTGTTSEPEEETVITDPREGWVLIDQEGFNYLEKMCDGPTLIYRGKVSKGGGVAAVPNSPECSDPLSGEEER